MSLGVELYLTFFLIFCSFHGFERLGLTSVFGQYCIAAAHIIFFFGKIRMSIVQTQLRKVIDKAVIVLMALFLLRIIQQEVPYSDGKIERMLWYSFYPCYLILGYYTMCIYQILDYNLPKYLDKKWFSLILELDILISVLVMTNDYHGLMFRFLPNFENYFVVYEMGPLGWAIKLYIMLQFLAPILLLLRDAYNFVYLRKNMILPQFISIYTFAYHILYTADIIFRPSEMPLVTGIAYTAYWYSAFGTGLILRNEKYMELFYASGIQKKLVEARLRQSIFIKLEQVIAELKAPMLRSAYRLERETSEEEKKKLLEVLRLNSSFIKKQCLMFLQGEIHGCVPVADFKSALKEGQRYAREAGLFSTINLQLELDTLPTNFALRSHNLILKALVYGLEEEFEGIFVNLEVKENVLEVNILADIEFKRSLEKFYGSLSNRMGNEENTSFTFHTTEDASSIKLVCEVVKA